MKCINALLFLLVFGANAQTAMLSEAYVSSERNLPASDPSLSRVPIGLDLMGGAEKGVTIFPNSQNDHILVSVAGTHLDKKGVTVINSSGQNVLKLSNRRENTFMIDVAGLRPGLYFIEVRSGANIYRKKWMRL